MRFTPLETASAAAIRVATRHSTVPQCNDAVGDYAPCMGSGQAKRNSPGHAGSLGIHAIGVNSPPVETACALPDKSLQIVLDKPDAL